MRKGPRLGARTVNRGRSRVRLGQFAGSMIQGPGGLTARAGFGAANSMMTGTKTTTKVGFGDVFGFF